MDRRNLEYFLAIVEYGGFTNAAHALHIAQPSLSQAVKGLEQRIGAKLFDRVGKGVKLTSVGEALLGPARQVMRDFDAADRAVANVSGLDGGRLIVAALPALSADPVSAWLGSFRQRFPKVSVRMLDPGMADILDTVRSGESELAVTMEVGPADDLSVEHLGDDEVYLVQPPARALAKNNRDSILPLKVLAEVELIAGTATQNILFKVLDRLGVSPRIALEADHREAIVPLVLAGAGSALLPFRSAMYARSLGAEVLHLDPPITRSAWVVHRRTDLSPAASSFLGLLREERAVWADAGGFRESVLPQKEFL